MKKVTLYTTPSCPYCVRAKRLLEKKGLDFEEIDLSQAPELRSALRKQTGGWSTVPMVFLGGEFLGGCDDLFALERSGELDRKLTQAA